MGFYLDTGFFDFRKAAALGYPWTWIIGGRGTGKSFGGLSTSVEDNVPFMLMQRKQSQLDVVNSPAFSPFKKINQKKGWNVQPKSVTKNCAAFYHSHTDKKGRIIMEGAPLGYTMALSTIGNVRGFDGSDVKRMLFDEFIPEKTDRAIRNEAEALVAAYETINRNRELEGEAPLQFFGMANALDLGNCHLVYHGLVRVLEKMERNGTTLYTDDRRGVCVIFLGDSPISEQKKDTALYKMLGENTAYSKMALGNSFAFEDRDDVRSRPLAEYRPEVTVGEITVYKHKSRPVYYVSPHRLGSPPTFGAGETDLARFRRNYSWLWTALLDHAIEFEDFLCKTLLTKYLG